MNNKNLPPIVSTYEKHFFDDLLGERIKSAKDKDEIKDIYTKSIGFCTSVSALEYILGKGADFSSHHAIIPLVDFLNSKTLDPNLQLFKFILKNGGKNLFSNNNSNKSQQDYLVKNIVLNPRAAKILSGLDIDFSDNKFNTGNLSVIEMMVSSSPKDALFFLQSPYLFSKNPEKQIDLLKKIESLSFKNLSKPSSSARFLKSSLDVLNLSHNKLLNLYKNQNISYTPDFIKSNSLISSTIKYESGKFSHLIPSTLKTKPNKETVLKKQKKSLQELKFLDSLGVDLINQTINKRRFLEWAVFHEDPGACKFLLKKGANPNDPISDRSPFSSILDMACDRGNKTIVSSLINHGADIHAKSKTNQTVLFSAIISSNYNLIKPLVEAGIDINHKDKNGETSLFYLSGATPKSVLCMEELVKCGADPFIKNNHGEYFHDMFHDKSFKKTCNDFIKSISSHQLKQNISAPSNKRRKKVF